MWGCICDKGSNNKYAIQYNYDLIGYPICRKLKSGAQRNQPRVTTLSQKTGHLLPSFPVSRTKSHERTLQARVTSFFITWILYKPDTFMAPNVSSLSHTCITYLCNTTVPSNAAGIPMQLTLSHRDTDKPMQLTYLYNTTATSNAADKPMNTRSMKCCSLRLSSLGSYLTRMRNKLFWNMLSLIQVCFITPDTH